MNRVRMMCTLVPVLLTARAFSQPAPSVSTVADKVVAAFITTNGYGNNLYLDNIRLGTQHETDLAVVRIMNIPPDTTYAIGSSDIHVKPTVLVLNIGRTDMAGSFTITMTGTPGGYSSTRSIPGIYKGSLAEVTFDELVIPMSTAMHFEIAGSLAGDQDSGNDTVRHDVTVFPGVQRTVLFEEATNTSCGPCATNNPYLDSYVQDKFDSLVAVKYHAWWPGAGDPMYTANTPENRNRIDYYNINGVPCLMIDGTTQANLPLSTTANMETPFRERLTSGTPIDLQLTEARIAGDSIVADITVDIRSPLLPGNYRLRTYAVERHIHYTAPPGTNNETDFYDVFRRAYPTIAGTSVSTAPGLYHYQVRYKREAAWTDSLIYTVAFVQNDITKEVFNAVKSRTTPSPFRPAGTMAATGNAVSRREGPTLTESYAPVPSTGSSLLDGPGVFAYQVFEGGFPAPGWRVGNPDAGMTFKQVGVANGPSFGGLRSLILPFYDYGNMGERDTLLTPIVNGLLATDTLAFDWAYATYPGYNDRLTVKISIDGGATFPFTVFNRDSATLPTAKDNYGSFVPSPADWGTFVVALAGIVSDVEPNAERPRAFSLDQNYPNPFNPTTRISYTLPLATDVSLTVYDLLGREVASLALGRQTSGTHTAVLNAANWASGMYTYVLRAGSAASARTMLLLK
jgi:hypothetical protein